MDWRKFFDFEADDKDKKKSDKKFNFKKFDDEDEEEEWFDLDTFFNNNNQFQFHGFPKSFMSSFKEIIKAMKEIDDETDQISKDKSVQKFYDNYSDFKQKSDKDLDGKIYAEQLDSLLKRINPELMLKNSNDENSQSQQNVVRKLTDEEKIMDIIHGTYKAPIIVYKPRKQNVHKAPLSPHHFSALPPFHEFPAPPSTQQSSASSRSWGKTVISIRNADGSYETRTTTKTPDGNSRTTITKKDPEGNASTQSFTGDEPQKNTSDQSSSKAGNALTNHEERNLISYNGYKIPCLW